MREMSAIVMEFVEEGNEKADLVERYLLQLEKSPSSREAVAEVFRAMHTIKGATGFLGFTKLSTLAHTGESLLVRLRDGALVANPQIVNAFCPLWMRSAKACPISRRLVRKAIGNTRL